MTRWRVGELQGWDLEVEAGGVVKYNFEKAGTAAALPQTLHWAYAHHVAMAPGQLATGLQASRAGFLETEGSRSCGLDCQPGGSGPRATARPRRARPGGVPPPRDTPLSPGAEAGARFPRGRFARGAFGFGQRPRCGLIRFGD